MTGICKNCKFLGKPVKSYDFSLSEDDPAYGLEIETKYRVCGYAEFAGMINDVVDGRVENPERKAFTIDGSGYYGALVIVDDFGCNEFSGRDDEN